MSFPKNILPAVFVVIGIVLCLVGGLTSVPGQSVYVMAGCVSSAASLLFTRPPRSIPSQAAALDNPKNEELEFEGWRQQQLEVLAAEADRLHEKNASLAERSARYQEFLEYPIEDETPSRSDDTTARRLSEQDRKVHAILEEEAKRVYEAIRNNEYVDNGSVNIDRIRDDALALVTQVARVYSPDSQNPLLETSFEQLARAASRTCLHTLVLLEQLPIDVKSYTINELHTYLRRAISAYGTYKQAAPWLKRLSRTAYAGRLVASTNPVTLGAWWLATEVTRRGASRLVENAVDRQAIAVLHDIVAVLGTEIASVYGPGFRQRDPAWVYGTELTEMLQAFPMSRESLSQGLQEITRLELRSEYDRIYLYRCLAQRRSAGHRLADPALLTRPERESIAKQLESFFRANLHGITEEDLSQWRTSVEARLDLRMQLQHQPEDDSDASAAIHSVAAFLSQVLTVPPAEIVRLVENSDLVTKIPIDQRAELFDRIGDADSTSTAFDPPDLDPASPVTELFLNDLNRTSVRSGRCDAHIESLLLETGSYFRRPLEESQARIDSEFADALQMRVVDGVSARDLNASVIRNVLHSLAELSDAVSIEAVFTDISRHDQLSENDLADAVILVYGDTAALFTPEIPNGPVWVSNSTTSIRRIPGYVIDDCDLSGGHWATTESGSLRISGTLKGRGFHRRFQPLLSRFPLVDET